MKPLFEALCKGAETNPDEVEDDEVSPALSFSSLRSRIQ